MQITIIFLFDFFFVRFTNWFSTAIECDVCCEFTESITFGSFILDEITRRVPAMRSLTTCLLAMRQSHIASHHKSHAIIN